MHVLHTKTKEKHDVVIEKVTSSEFNGIRKSKKFEFDWSAEKKYLVYRLRMKESEEILGLMSIIDWPEELRIEIHLLESSKENVGKEKTYTNIAGCLIAFACGISFERGYYGFISLVPKTELRNYYMEEYGMENGGRSIYSDIENSAILMKKYL